MTMINIFFFLSLVSSISFASVQDFCVADPNGPQSPSGYSCKNPDQVTANDFAFSGLVKAGNTSNMIKAAVTTGFAPDFEGVNGLGVSVTRLDLAVGGVVPLHIHSGASEVLIVIEGTIRAGIISSANKVYLKTLQKGEVMVFPQGLVHFALNNGRGPALAFAGFGSSNPGVQLVPNALFASDLPSELIEATTLRVKEVFLRLDYGDTSRISKLILFPINYFFADVLGQVFSVGEVETIQCAVVNHVVVIHDCHVAFGAISLILSTWLNYCKRFGEMI